VNLLEGELAAYEYDAARGCEVGVKAKACRVAGLGVEGKRFG
jgi:hypothetical protein